MILKIFKIQILSKKPKHGGLGSGYISLCTASEKISRDADVQLYTVFPNTNAFKALFDYLRPKALKMIYMKGEQQTSAEEPKRYSGRDSHIFSPFQSEPGPSRKLGLEQELLIVMIRLCLALCVDDLAFRFDTPETLIRSIITTWIKLMNMKLSWLVTWPSREQTKLCLSVLRSFIRKLGVSLIVPKYL